MAETTTDKNLTDEEDETDLSNNHDLVSVYFKKKNNESKIFFYCYRLGQFFLLSSIYSYVKSFFVLESW